MEGGCSLVPIAIAWPGLVKARCFVLPCALAYPEFKWSRCFVLPPPLCCAVAYAGEALEKVHIIELNPFLCSTDGCLFSWASERAILEHGPFCFRLLER